MWCGRGVDGEALPEILPHVLEHRSVTPLPVAAAAPSLDTLDLVIHLFKSERISFQGSYDVKVSGG